MKIIAPAAFVALLSAVPAWAGNVANCEVLVMREVGDTQGVAAAFSDGAEVVASMLDPDRPTIAAIDNAPIQALMCTRRNPVPDAEDAPLIASGIPFILSTDFNSQDAPLVTVALDADRQAIVRIAVGLSAGQETALAEFIDGYEPAEPKYTGGSDAEDGGSGDLIDVEDVEPPIEPDAQEDAEAPE